MSLDKAVKHGKERRKPYHGSKSFDRTCCNHGTCKSCVQNRKIQFLKEIERVRSLEADKDEV